MARKEVDFQLVRFEVVPKGPKAAPPKQAPPVAVPSIPPPPVRLPVPESRFGPPAPLRPVGKAPAPAAPTRPRSARPVVKAYTPPAPPPPPAQNRTKTMKRPSKIEWPQAEYWRAAGLDTEVRAPHAAPPPQKTGKPRGDPYPQKRYPLVRPILDQVKPRKLRGKCGECGSYIKALVRAGDSVRCPICGKTGRV